MQLVVSNIHKTYASVTAVNDLSFRVNHGEIFAILGPNGAGKSSTIRMLIGLTEPDSGDIQFTQQGQTLPAPLRSGDFAYLPEERGLFQEASIVKTLVYMGQLKGMEKADAHASAQQWLQRFDLESRINDPLKTLSKGNQQKVQLISAIIHRPSIAFLDEPFSGLDPINQEKVIEFLEELKAQGTTIVLSAHQMSLVEKLADRFLLMDQGRAALYGDIASIRQQSNLGSTIVLTFENSPDVSAFEGYQGVVQVTQTDPQSIALTLEVGTSLPYLLQVMLNEHKVQSLQTSQPTLHDIYLNRLQGGAK